MTALLLPNLDDRRWTDLVEEGRALIPLHAPAWTDHNIHDPGITLVELFAWLAEMELYQLNRITSSQLRKFLALVGVRPRPPRAARVFLSLTGKAEGMLAPIRTNTEWHATGPELFAGVGVRTLSDITPVKSRLVSVHAQEAAGWQDWTERLQRGEGWPLFGPNPVPGAAFYLGFDAPLPSDVPLSLAFVFTDGWSSLVEHDAILEEIRQQRGDCLPITHACPGGEPVAAPDTLKEPSLPPHHSARLNWEYADATGVWRALEPAEVIDETRSLTLNGRVVLRLPSPTVDWAGPSLPAARHYLRCRLIAGAYDVAPIVRHVLFNAVEAEQAVSPTKAATEIPVKPPARGEWIGTGTGWPRQEFTLFDKPVQAESLRVFTSEDGAWLPWSLVSDFDASGPADRHVTLDAMLGLVRCGDGERGRVVPREAAVFASYRTTRASAGNVSANATWRFSKTPTGIALTGPEQDLAVQLVVTNPGPASGGADAETLAETAGRAVRSLHDTPRAVTLADYERLTLQMPGVRIARAIARANEHPVFRCLSTAGVVTVTIVPYLPLGRPAPSRGLLHVVHAYLNRRRILGTRVEVAGPVYVEVVVEATLKLQRGAGAEETMQRARAALARFFDPLTGGSDGHGWPLGRDVYRSEVLQVLDETTGVENVSSLALFADDGPTSCGNLCIGARGLVASGAHRLTAVDGTNGCLTRK